MTQMTQIAQIPKRSRAARSAADRRETIRAFACVRLRSGWAVFLAKRDGAAAAIKGMPPTKPVS